MANINSKLAPYTGSFDFTIDGKEALINECLPKSADTAAVTKDKLARLVTIVYLMLDNIYYDQNDGPVKF